MLLYLYIDSTCNRDESENKECVKETIIQSNTVKQPKSVYMPSVNNEKFHTPESTFDCRLTGQMHRFNKLAIILHHRR